MHQVNVYTHFFYVPNRIVWSNWEDFITGGDVTKVDPIAPFVDIQPDALPIGSLGDYLGLPAGQTGTNNMIFSPIPFGAEKLIYDEYYRDQNLIPAEDYVIVDGDNSAEAELINDIIGTPRIRAWQHDYFTSALPWKIVILR